MRSILFGASGLVLASAALARAEDWTGYTYS